MKKLKQRRPHLLVATMKDFELVNYVIRKKNKKTFPHITADILKERISAGACLMLRNKCGIGVVRVYKKKTLVGIKENGIYTLPGDVRFWLYGSTIDGKGYGTKFFKDLLKTFSTPGRKMWSTIRSDNKSSRRWHEKRGYKLINEFERGAHKYSIYIYQFKTPKLNLSKYKE